MDRVPAADAIATENPNANSRHDRPGLLARHFAPHIGKQRRNGDRPESESSCIAADQHGRAHWCDRQIAPVEGTIYFARSELRRAGDVSPLILRAANNQGIDIPRSPKTDRNQRGLMFSAVYSKLLFNETVLEESVLYHDLHQRIGPVVYGKNCKEPALH